MPRLNSNESLFTTKLKEILEVKYIKLRMNKLNQSYNGEKTNTRFKSTIKNYFYRTFYPSISGIIDYKVL